MIKFKKSLCPIFLSLLISIPLQSQNISGRIENINIQKPLPDKCGEYNKQFFKQQLETLGDHWGYAYDSLLADLGRWSQSPYVQIDSIGASVQNRALWQLTITSDSPPPVLKRTVFIHARTHPGEVQAWWVTDEIINLLLSEQEFARFLRDRLIFYIIPMYNPDGVELEYPRENANGIDLESNWDAIPVEPEVEVLRSRFEQLMSSEASIEVALNMHSAYSCKRYFVYHAVAGTSAEYSALEIQFIEGVRSYFQNGIEPWNYFVSWTNYAPTYYPESWFWHNFRERVMALTYEDMNCEAAGDFDKTAFALLHGIADYMQLVSTVDFAEDSRSPESFTLYQNYPNPIGATSPGSYATIIRYELKSPQFLRLVLYDVLGREVKILDSGFRNADIHRIYFDATGLASGVYYYRLDTGKNQQVKKLLFRNSDLKNDKSYALQKCVGFFGGDIIF